MSDTDETWRPRTQDGKESGDGRNNSGTHDVAAKARRGEGENGKNRGNNGGGGASGGRAVIYPVPKEVLSDEVSSDEGEQETLSGMRIWPGLMPLVEEVYEEHGEAVEPETVATRMQRRLERYRWFRERVGQPRSFETCTRILRRPPRETGAWERALVELTMLEDVKARIFLETWRPPAEKEVVEEFRKICVYVARY